MEQKNMSVFGNSIGNHEIGSFIRLVNMTREIFNQELAVLEIMPGGLTNKNFRAVTEDGTQVAIRLAGAGTANYINRPGEKHNATHNPGRKESGCKARAYDAPAWKPAGGEKPSPDRSAGNAGRSAGRHH